MRDLFLGASRTVTPLLRDDRVTSRWREPSKLTGMTIGGLAGHLVRAMETVELYLDEPEPPDEDLIRDDEYFARALRFADEAAHRGVRERGEAAGAVGPDALAAEHEARIERLTARLPAERAGRRVTVIRGTARMTLDDYLPTRLVELVVHADDLAASVDADPPPFEPRVMGMVIDILVGTARHLHGDLAVVRALARRERDPVEALRVL